MRKSLQVFLRWTGPTVLYGKETRRPHIGDRGDRQLESPFRVSYLVSLTRNWETFSFFNCTFNCAHATAGRNH